MINSNRSSIIVSDKLKHENKVVSFTSIKSFMNKSSTGSKSQKDTDSGKHWSCSDPSYESDPSNEYSPLGLTHVMNSIFLDPSNEFLTKAVNIGIPKQTLGLCFHVSK